MWSRREVLSFCAGHCHCSTNMHVSVPVCTKAPIESCRQEPCSLDQRDPAGGFPYGDFGSKHVRYPEFILACQQQEVL